MQTRRSVHGSQRHQRVGHDPSAGDEDPQLAASPCQPHQNGEDQGDQYDLNEHPGISCWQQEIGHGTCNAAKGSGMSGPIDVAPGVSASCGESRPARQRWPPPAMLSRAARSRGANPL